MLQGMKTQKVGFIAWGKGSCGLQNSHILTGQGMFPAINMFLVICLNFGFLLILVFLQVSWFLCILSLNWQSFLESFSKFSVITLLLVSGLLAKSGIYKFWWCSYSWYISICHICNGMACVQFSLFPIFPHSRKREGKKIVPANRINTYFKLWKL